MLFPKKHWSISVMLFVDMRRTKEILKSMRVTNKAPKITYLNYISLWISQ